jgi:hypothetical protein
VPVFPQASVTVQFLVVEKVQSLPVSKDSVPLATKSVEQLSLTIAVPKAAVISAGVGLQSTVPAGVKSITGSSVSLVYVSVWEVVPVLPQVSVTVQFLVVEKLQPEPVSVAWVPVAIKPVEQLSLTVAVPKAAVISAGVGLQSTVPAGVKLITGSSVSLVYVSVWEVVPVLPQASVTVQFLVVENVQPEPVSVASVPVAVKPMEQLSVTVAVPKAAVISAAVGLQPNVPAGVKVITGSSVSLFQV